MSHNLKLWFLHRDNHIRGVFRTRSTCESSRDDSGNLTQKIENTLIYMRAKKISWEI